MSDAAARHATARPDERRVILIVLIVAVAAFMQMLDGAIVATAIPAMARGFAVSPIDLGMGITAYVMATAILLPTSGWLADRVGARRLFIATLIAFTLASMLCGISRTLPQFIAARVLQGLGGAVLGPVGSIILMRVIDRRDLIRMMNIFSAPMLVAPVLGPPVGGLVTTWFGWPWIFYLNVPIGFAGAFLAWRFIAPQPRLRRPFDGWGFLLNGSALATLIYGFGALGEPGTPHMPALCSVLAGLVLAVIAVRHARRARHPLLSVEAADQPTYNLVTVWAMPFMRFPIATLPFVLPIMLQVGFGLTAAASGLLFLGHTLGDLMTKTVTSRIFARFGYRSAMRVCIVGFAASVAACALIAARTPFPLIILLLFVGGCFRSVLMTANGTLSYADIEPEVMANATTLNQVIMQLVQAIGISLTVITLDIAIARRGGIAGAIGASDCRVALIVAAIASLGALIPISRLARDAGSALSGHRAG